MSNTPFVWETTTRAQCKASILIEGLAGHGKSGLAIAIAKALVGDYSKIAGIDTENRSLKLFEKLKNIDGKPIEAFPCVFLDDTIGYRPSYYLEIRNQAIENGCEAFIEDSISHAWAYRGGVLEIVNDAKDRQDKKDKYAAWNDPEVVKEKNNLLPLIRDYRCHVIATVRVKEKMEYQDGDDGKKKLVSLGELQIMQGDLKYEPDLVIQMIEPGNTQGKVIKYPRGIITKSRYAIFDLDEEYEFTPDVLEQLRVYLAEGADPEELREQQRKEYAEAVKEYLDNNSTKRTIWKALKADAGYETAKLDQIPLDDLKQLYVTLIG